MWRPCSWTRAGTSPAASTGSGGRLPPTWWTGRAGCWPGCSAGMTGRARPRAASSKRCSNCASMEPMSAGAYIKQLELGPMQNFVYLIGDPETRECVVVDPAWEIDAILAEAAADDMRIRDVLITHTHQDHVGGHLFGHDIPGVAELLEKNSAKVHVHKAEREFLRGFGSDLVKVESGDTLAVGKFPLTFIHTPGHTPGS